LSERNKIYFLFCLQSPFSIRDDKINRESEGISTNEEEKNTDKEPQTTDGEQQLLSEEEIRLSQLADKIMSQISQQEDGFKQKDFLKLQNVVDKLVIMFLFIKCSLDSWLYILGFIVLVLVLF